jgi:hypothetical protein
MDKEKMLALADFIEKVPDDKFHMGFFGKPANYESRRVVCKEDLNVCGTACCIAGYVVVNKGYCVTPGGFVYDDIDESDYIGQAETLAARELRLDSDQATALFFDRNWPYQFKEDANNPKVAAQRIRHMVETGE